METASNSLTGATDLLASRQQIKQAVQNALKHLDGMKEVEELVREKMVSDAALLREIPAYLLELGGKRIRPALTLLVARCFGPRADHPHSDVLAVAAGIELIHMATLLHDDIIDRSPLRRHKKSPFLKYGLTNTLLAGDFLLVRAFSLCASLDDYIIAATEKACIELTEGEILETSLFQETHDLESSLRVARKKTASLFRLAADCGGYLSINSSPDQEPASSDEPDSITEELRSFGENLGLAFQILDDILDVTSEEAELGKRSGIDILERKPSIVNVLWLESGSTLAERLLKEPGEGEEEFVQLALNELRGSDVIAKARELAAGYAREASLSLEAARCISPAVDAGALQTLRALIDFTLQRVV